jgi:hypothetical protein
MKRLISFVSDVIRAEREEWLLARIDGLPGWPTSWESRANPQSPGVRNLPSRRTGCVVGNEQCVSLSAEEADSMSQGFSWTEGELSHEIAALFDLSVGELKSRWRSIYGTEPPPRSSRKLLVSAIAYRLQERALGGLKPSVRRLLERASEDTGSRRILRAGQSQEPL